MKTFPIRLKTKLIEISRTTPSIRGSSHCAALVYRKKVLSVGTNQLKTHPLQKQYGRNEKAIFLHAEIDAIIRCINKHGVEILQQSTLYVLRTTPSGAVGDSCPCAGCTRAIEAFKIKEVVHT